MLDGTMKDKYAALDYCVLLMSRGPNSFTPFTDVLIETKQNVIAYLLLKTTL